jgi:hypothetical protein
LFFTHIKSNIIMCIVLSTILSPSPSLSFSFSLPLPLLLPLLSSASARKPATVRADPRTQRGRTPATARTPTYPRPHLYNPRPHSHFLLFLFFAFGWSCRICLATPISTCKGRSGHKHFEGDPLAFFAKQKFKGCI